MTKEEEIAQIQQEIMQMVAGCVEELLAEKQLPNNHENRVACMREILNRLQSDGFIASYTWVGDDIRLQLRKH